MRWQPLHVCSLAALVVASTVQYEHVRHEERDLTSKWSKVAKLPAHFEVPVRISLAQSNLEYGEAALLAVLVEVMRLDYLTHGNRSSPLSTEYGRHWTSDNVRDTFAPSTESTQNAIKWLGDSGISPDRIQHTASKGALTFTATIAELEALTLADYHMYEHPNMEFTAIGCDDYHIPAHLRGHVDYITPGVGLESTPKQHGVPALEKRSKQCPTNPNITADFHPLSQLPSSFPLDKCAKGITPECIRTLYDVPTEGNCHPDNSIGIYSLLYTYVQRDLDLFFKYFSSSVPQGSRPNFVGINGVKLQNKVSTVLNFEANLDLEMAWPLAYPENITFYSVAPTKQEIQSLSGINKTSTLYSTLLSQFGFDNLLSAFDSSYCDNSTGSECGVQKPPKVVSISYGPDELFVPEAKAKRLCHEFMKLGLQGTTILAASGDGGLAPQLDPSYCYGPKENVFNPSILASCPWVTAVGGTQLAANAGVSVPGGEIVANQSAPGLLNFSPGSGFSNYHAMPAYQKGAVDGYFKAHPNPYKGYHFNGTKSVGADCGVYSIGGRAYPDVSALSANIWTLAGGCAGLDGGTSYSSPIFAGIISRLNGERLAAGKSTLGFINPALYAHPEVMNDVVIGHNYGCKTQGFSAAKGWDIASGLGSPNYPKMKKLFMSLFDWT